MPFLMEPITLSPNTPFLILASDGLWNVMGGRAVQIASELQHKGNKKERGSEVVEER